MKCRRQPVPTKCVCKSPTELMSNVQVQPIERRCVIGPFKSMFALQGEGFSKQHTESYMEKGGGVLQRKYVRSCNFQMVSTCEAS